MVRSAAAVVAVLILSGFAAVQQMATHNVVAGDTLWDLAQRYYQNPFDWRRIWEANRDQVMDPNVIEPGWVLNIPGRDATVSEVTVQGPAQPAAPRTSMRDTKTVFHQDTTLMRAGVVRSAERTVLAVPRDVVYSSPWLVGLDEVPVRLGSMDSFAGGASQSKTPRSWNRVNLTLSESGISVGTQLLTYRVTRTIEGVGSVAMPTGVVTISELHGQEAVAIVTKEFDLMALGDLLAPLPAYGLQRGQAAQPVSGGSEAMIMGFAGEAEVRQLGAVAFLDQGVDDGVALGDEFEYVNRLAGRDVVEGRLQVVGVSGDRASARIMALNDAVFRQGLVVRLARKMR